MTRHAFAMQLALVQIQEAVMQDIGLASSNGNVRKVTKNYSRPSNNTKSPSQIQAIDMGRRALHNEGSEILQTRLDGKVETDFDTARRLFTLICVLQTR